MKILSGDLIVTSTLTRAVELKEIEEIDNVDMYLLYWKQKNKRMIKDTRKISISFQLVFVLVVDWFLMV